MWASMNDFKRSCNCLTFSDGSKGIVTFSPNGSLRTERELRRYHPAEPRATTLVVTSDLDHSPPSLARAVKVWCTNGAQRIGLWGWRGWMGVLRSSPGLDRNCFGVNRKI